MTALKNKSIFFITALVIFSYIFHNSAAWSQNSKTNHLKKSTKPTPHLQNLSDQDEFDDYERNNVSEIYDPLEKINRKIYSFNDAFDRYFLEYIAEAYHGGVPQKARSLIRNFLINLTLPISAFNSLLQGKTDNSMATISNFLINSTVGIFGIYDIASKKGIRYKQEDLGQTLGYYGLNPGAYLMIPILGPSSTRDFGGWLIDKTVNPIELNLIEIGGKEDLIGANYRIGIATSSGIDKRESLLTIIDDVRRESFDPYATIRSAYLQKRASDVKN